jgi:hypothetical protein
MSKESDKAGYAEMDWFRGDAFTVSKNAWLSTVPYRTASILLFLFTMTKKSMPADKEAGIFFGIW